MSPLTPSEEMQSATMIAFSFLFFPPVYITTDPQTNQQEIFTHNIRVISDKSALGFEVENTQD